MVQGDIMAEESDKTYDIFISYRQLDAKDTALALYTMLSERFKLRIFFDAQELDNLHDLEELVRKSRVLMPIISPGYLDTLTVSIIA